MIIVSDTTPIISLMKIDQLDLLEKLFKKVKIPVAVYHELTTNQKFKQEAELIKITKTKLFFSAKKNAQV